MTSLLVYCFLFGAIGAARSHPAFPLLFLSLLLPQLSASCIISLPSARPASPAAAALQAVAVLGAQQDVVDDSGVGQDCAGAAARDAGGSRRGSKLCLVALLLKRALLRASLCRSGQLLLRHAGPLRTALPGCTPLLHMPLARPLLLHMLSCFFPALHSSCCWSWRMATTP